MKTPRNEKALTGRSRWHSAIQHFSPFIPNSSAFLLALLAGLWLFRTSISIGPISTIIALGLDEQRASLVVALLMTMGAALVGAAGGKRKEGASLGAGLVFCWSYLVGFIQHELQPVSDPLGNVEPLNSGALLHTSLVLVAMALLSAFVGAAVGVALHEVIFAPLSGLVRLLRQRSARNASLQEKKVRAVRDVFLSSLGALILILLLFLASSGVDLFVYSPDVGLHLPPILRHTHEPASMPTHGTIVHDELVSVALGGQKKAFLIYLPPSYNTVEGRTRRYPCLYLLHGSPGKDSDWLMGGKADQAADTLSVLGKIPELIMVLPDGNGRPAQTSEWGNSYDQQQKIETYLATDLVTYVDARYRTIADASHRGIAGLSMGGFGAMNIAVHHPDIFGYVSSLGGYYRAEGSIWGNNPDYMRNNSPIEVLPQDKQAWRLHCFIGAATKDQPYYNDSMQFVQELAKLHIDYTFDVEKGSHAWSVWKLQMYSTLLWLHWGD